MGRLCRKDKTLKPGALLYFSYAQQRDPETLVCGVGNEVKACVTCVHALAPSSRDLTRAHNCK